MTACRLALLFGYLAFLSFPPPAVAGERVALHLKDGSVLKGELLGEAPDALKLKTSFGEVAIPRADVAAFYVEKHVEAAPDDPGGQKNGKEGRPAAPTGAPPAERSAPRIRDAGGSPPAAPPEALLTLEDEELINLLQKSGKPSEPEHVTPEGAPGEPPQAPVKRIYTYESEKGNLLPPELTELELPKPKGPQAPAGADKGALDAAGKAVDAVVGGGATPPPAAAKGVGTAGTAEVKATAGGKEVPQAADGGGKPAAGASGGTAEVKVYDPPKGTIDGKIHKQFKRHGGLSVAPDDFRQMKDNEIDSLLKKHLPGEGSAEINVKDTVEVKRDGK